MRSRRLSALAATLALAACAAAPSAASVSAAPIHGPAAVAAKTCRSGFTHAVMPDRSHKCLHAGEFCRRQRSWQRVYRSKGFYCAPTGRLRSR